jgi:hypothetical protein
LGNIFNSGQGATPSVFSNIFIDFTCYFDVISLYLLVFFCKKQTTVNIMKAIIVKLALTLSSCLFVNYLSAQRVLSPIPIHWFSKALTYAVQCKNHISAPQKAKAIESNVITITIINCAEKKEDKKIVQ